MPTRPLLILLTGLGSLALCASTASAQLALTSPSWTYNCGDAHIAAEPLVPFDLYLETEDTGAVSRISFTLWPGGSSEEIALLETEFYGEPRVFGTPLTGVHLLYDDCSSVPVGAGPVRVARFRLMLLTDIQYRTIAVQPVAHPADDWTLIRDCEDEELGSTAFGPSVALNLPDWSGVFANVRHLDAPERIVVPGEAVELPITMHWELPTEKAEPARCVPDPDAYPRHAVSAEIEIRFDPTRVAMSRIRSATEHPAIDVQGAIEGDTGVARVLLQSHDPTVDATQVGPADALLFLDLRLLPEAEAAAITFGPVVVRAADGDRLPVRLSSGSIGLHTIGTETLSVGALKCRW